MLPATLTDAHGPLVRVNPIVAPGGSHPAVQRLIFADGVRIIAKQYLFYAQTAGHPYDLLDTEIAVTRCLADAGCRVARVLATDPETGVVYLEDIPSQTLDDVVQTGTPTTRARIADLAIAEFDRLQVTFEKNEDVLQQRVAPGTEPESVTNSFLQVFSDLPEHTPGREVLLSLAQTVAARPLLLGPTDYNARNILIPEVDAPGFIDLAKIGHDWPERRLVQYLTSLGAGRPGSTVTSLLDPISLRSYGPAQSPKVRENLDAHHLLLHALAMLRGGRVTHRALTLSLSRCEIVADARLKMGEVWDQAKGEPLEARASQLR